MCRHVDHALKFIVHNMSTSGKLKAPLQNEETSEIRDEVDEFWWQHEQQHEEPFEVIYFKRRKVKKKRVSVEFTYSGGSSIKQLMMMISIDDLTVWP